MTQQQIELCTDKITGLLEPDYPGISVGIIQTENKPGIISIHWHSISSYYAVFKDPVLGHLPVTYYKYQKKFDFNDANFNDVLKQDIIPYFDGLKPDQR